MLKMNKVSRIQINRFWMMVAFSSVILVASACGQAATPGANSSTNPDAAVVASLAPLATEISQPAATDAPPVTANNCTLLSNDEIGNVLDEAVVEARQPAKDGSVCDYQTQNLILELTFLHKFGGFNSSTAYMDNIRTNDETTVDAPGLGDEALYHGQPAYRLLLVRKGDTVYGFGVRNASADSFSSPDNAQDLEKSMADLLLGRAP